MNAQAKENREIILKDREYLTVTGVTDVTSFDENGILLETSDGSLSIDGEGLHITKLTVEQGVIEIVGRICGLVYFESQPKKRRGLFAGER